MNALINMYSVPKQLFEHLIEFQILQKKFLNIRAMFDNL